MYCARLHTGAGFFAIGEHHEDGAGELRAVARAAVSVDGLASRKRRATAPAKPPAAAAGYSSESSAGYNRHYFTQARRRRGGGDDVGSGGR